jgi:hypothetical protein
MLLFSHSKQKIMENVLLIEIVAIAVGIIVVAIETLIIFMLRGHVKLLDKHLINNERLMKEFRHSISDHLDHLNEHSHEIEEKLEKLFIDICQEESRHMKRHQKPLEQKPLEQKQNSRRLVKK